MFFNFDASITTFLLIVSTSPLLYGKIEDYIRLVVGLRGYIEYVLYSLVAIIKNGPSSNL